MDKERKLREDQIKPLHKYLALYLLSCADKELKENKKNE